MIRNHSLIYHRISSLAESTENNKSIKLLSQTNYRGYDSCGISYKIYNAFNEVIFEIFILLLLLIIVIKTNS